MAARKYKTAVLTTAAIAALALVAGLFWWLWPFAGARTSQAMVPAVAQGGQRREVFVPANDVSFTISTQQHSYRTGQEIWVTYSIVNISNHALYVPREWSETCLPKPHIWAWFESPGGQHFVPGYAGDCSPTAQSLTKRMAKEAVRLEPRQRFTGTIKLETNLFGGLLPGIYRIEAVLSGWREDEFDQVQRSELMKMGIPFIRGEVPASSSVILTR